MERKDVMEKNIGIFNSQGGALNQFAKPGVKCLVVGNPANTNAAILKQERRLPRRCIISHPPCSRASHPTSPHRPTLLRPTPNHSLDAASQAAPKVLAKNVTALTRLDHNRAKAMLAIKAGVPLEKVDGAIIWGNHSSTQYPVCRPPRAPMLQSPRHTSPATPRLRSSFPPPLSSCLTTPCLLSHGTPSPHLHPIFTPSAPHLHPIFTSSSPHLHLIPTPPRRPYAPASL